MTKWQGCHPVREKRKFFKSRGILQKVSENLSSCQSQWKVREFFWKSQGIFFNGGLLFRIFFLTEAGFFFVFVFFCFVFFCFFWRRIFFDGGLFLEKRLNMNLPVAYLVSRLMQGQWKLFWGQWKVREKLGNFFSLTGLQPWSDQILNI